MARFDLRDYDWYVIQPEPPDKPRGGTRAGDCCVLYAFLAAANPRAVDRYSGQTRPLVRP
jgi:hypothetical protein